MEKKTHKTFVIPTEETDCESSYNAYEEAQKTANRTYGNYCKRVQAYCDALNEANKDLLGKKVKVTFKHPFYDIILSTIGIFVSFYPNGKTYSKRPYMKIAKIKKDGTPSSVCYPRSSSPYNDEIISIELID